VLRINGADELRGLLGRHLGYSDWLLIDQRRVDEFAEASSDLQWIHIDPERAADGPFGRTVVHGNLLLALTSRLVRRIVIVEGFRSTLNYGYDRVRFLSPVPVGAELRAGAVLHSVRDVRGGIQYSLGVRYEVRHSAVPAGFARIVLRSVR
jgi:acyl dehydratase